MNFTVVWKPAAEEELTEICSFTLWVCFFTSRKTIVLFLLSVSGMLPEDRAS